MITVFDGVNINFSKGFNVILGPNGAGKSTLLKVIFGLLKFDGDVIYNNENISKLSIEDKTKFMAHLPQMDVDISTLTVLEMVLLGRLPELGHKVKDEDLDITMETIKLLNIEYLAMRNFSELSGGQKKMVFIAQTLVRKPRLMLLDEPVNSLDLQKQLELCQLLQNVVQEENVDIIVVLHDINLAARYANHIVVMDNNGNCYGSGTPKEVITNKMLKEVYGVKADISINNDNIPIVFPLSSVRKN